MKVTGWVQQSFQTPPLPDALRQALADGTILDNTLMAPSDGDGIEQAVGEAGKLGLDSSGGAAPYGEGQAVPLGAFQTGLSEGARRSAHAVGPGAENAALDASDVIHGAAAAASQSSPRAVTAADTADTAAAPRASGASQPRLMPVGCATDVPPGGRRGSMVQLITCGVGEEYANLERYHRDQFHNKLNEFIMNQRCFRLDDCPAIHLDARVFSDPERHGREIINRMVAHENFRPWIRYAYRTFAKALVNRSDGSMLSAVVFCRSGRHRGGTAAVILEHLFLHVGWKCRPTVHITIDKNRHCCSCNECRRDHKICESSRAALERAVSELSAVLEQG